MDIKGFSSNPIFKVASEALMSTMGDMTSHLANEVKKADETGKCPKCGKVIARIKKKANKLEEVSPVTGHIINHYFNLYTKDGRVRTKAAKSKAKQTKSKGKKNKKNKC